MQTVNRVNTLREAVDELRGHGSIALVPTMGALHDGHLALVREAARRAASVVVSIFVNPSQFGPNEDFSAYPRQLERDAGLLEREGVVLLWVPTVEEMYPDGFATTVSVSGLSDGLCGAFRPGHFDGVASVVLKLFNQVRPDMAIFGEKDWQQLQVIRRMARDLDLLRPRAPQIIGLPTVREADGLAMSSRNNYLSPELRKAAAAIPQAMAQAVASITADADVPTALAGISKALLAAGFDTIDYVELADAETLVPLSRLADRAGRLLVAAHIGGTRLIDNMPVAAGQATDA